MADPLTNLPDNSKITGNNSTLDPAILTAIKAYPNASKSQIANIVKDMGVTNHIQSVYNRLKKKDYLNKEIAEIETQHHQQLVREDYPLARKRLAKALKDKDLTHKEAFPFVKLAYDKVHGETFKNAPSAGIPMVAIQNAQIIVQGDIKQGGGDE